jgi:rhomboid protease GluP
MPEKTQTVPLQGHDIQGILSLAYGSFLQLGWTIKYAGVKMLIGYTPRSWKKYDEEITISAEENQLTVNSKMIHREAFDMMGKNKKHIEEFLAAFEKIKTSATVQQLSEWQQKIVLLKENTKKAAEQEIKQAEGVNKAMNLSGGKIYVTYGIMAINVLVFIAMVVSGISFMQPGGLDILNWGANYLPLTAAGDWWRLITCVFVHIGVIHLLFNMYALYTISVYLEPLLGKAKFIIAYICTGIFASLASLWWHHPPVPSAGASGAIFGMYGVFLALLTTQLVPQQVRKSLLQSIGIFVLYNLVYGLKSGVDNSAHIGGLLSGLVIGYLYYQILKSNEPGNKKTLIPGIIILVTIVVVIFYLENESKKLSPAEKIITKNMLDASRYKDGQKFLEKYEVFIDMQNIALAPLNDTTLTNGQLINKLNQVSLPEWNKAQELVNEVKTYDVSDNYKKKAEVMQRYVELRKEQISILQKMLINRTDSIVQQVNKLAEKISQTVQELDSL